MSEQHREVSADVLIVGSGGAALRAALSAASEGADVLVVIKGEFRRSGATFHSVAEVGAFNVPDDAGRTGDSSEVFLDDILAAGQGMSDPRLSRILAEEAGDALGYLESFGVHFEREDERYLVFRACFSSRPRSHVIKDHFKPIVKALGAEATRLGVRVLDRMMIVNLIVRDGECLGAYALDGDGLPVVIRAKAVVLTTGGASQLFATNLYPSDITGDGYAMARRCGAQLVNMEFMQAGVSIVSPFVNLFGNYLWHAHPRLTDRDGVPFLADYLPPGLTVEAVIDEKQRHFPFSASDISRYVEIGIQTAINDGRGTPEGGVYLDFIDCDFGRILAEADSSIARMWPLTYDWYKARGTDLYRDKVQIACSAHAINGGLRIDANAESNIKGLFAAGEVAAGPHGADRLGGNMSVTCQVFGRRAGRAAAERARSRGHSAVAGLFGEHSEFLAQFPADGTEPLAVLRRELQLAANRHLLILRDADGLQDLRRRANEIRAILLSRGQITTPQDQVNAIELLNMCEVADMMAMAALERAESRGSHYRQDRPASDGAQETNILVDSRAPDGFFRARLGELN
ncbi:FAD-binding protein [Aquabacter sp. CN5-332]|uniref:FAD-binding protein n=1 Tax=Aquabacter sp. CN5-332 TaxID=3156608 RepID=UPI0032B41335